MVVFLPFPGWQSLVGFISSASVLSYGIGPIALAAIRRQQPDIERPYKLPWARFWAPVAFIISNLIVYWTGWNTNSKLFLAVLLGFIVLAVAYSTQPESERPQLSLGNGIWLFPYFIGFAILSYLGSFGGGLSILPFGWDMLVVALYSLLIYFWAVRIRLSDEETKQYVLDLES
jgi:amino acid transporter